MFKTVHCSSRWLVLIAHLLCLWPSCGLAIITITLQWTQLPTIIIWALRGTGEPPEIEDSPRKYCALVSYWPVFQSLQDSCIDLRDSGHLNPWKNDKPSKNDPWTHTCTRLTYANYLNVRDVQRRPSHELSQTSYLTETVSLLQTGDVHTQVFHAKFVTWIPTIISLSDMFPPRPGACTLS